MTTIDTTVLHWLLLFAAAVALLLGAVHDVAVRTVPNLVSAIVAAAGLGLNALDARLGSAVFCGGLVFAGRWCCWRQGSIGGGDVKLLSACAMLVPPAAVPELVLATAIAGGAGAGLSGPRATAAARRNTAIDWAAADWPDWTYLAR
jgi:prepilin peptidase CpaA